MNHSQKQFSSLFKGNVSKVLAKAHGFNNKVLPLGLIATVATGSLLAPGLTRRVNAELQDSPKTVIDQVWQIVNNEFVDRSFNQVDWQKTRSELLGRNYDNNQQAYKAIRQSLKLLGDPYTRFLDPAEFQALTNQTSGELSGIGIRLTIDEQSSALTVVESLKNSPAIQAGIKAGDQIIKIDGKPTVLMSLEQASEYIRGEVGTNVKLEVASPGKRSFEVTLTRTQIEVPSVSYTLNQEKDLRVGYIKLDEFSSHAPEQMKEAIEDLTNKQVSGFVLDLRGNPGGLLFASVDIARMWMKQGAIVRTSDRKGGDRQFSANNSALTDLPLVVLVDGNSASASEILAGALKDNKRAKVVGTRTFGKGTVQSVHPLFDGSGLAVTISRYFPPSGININKFGISPDVQVELTRDQYQSLQKNPSSYATVRDPQYARAIAELKTSRNAQSDLLPDPVSIR